MKKSSFQFTHETAAQYAEMLLGHVAREYPSKVTHLILAQDDIQTPRDLYPVFHGCYDWHSCVHSFWLLAHILRRYPDLDECSHIREMFERRLTSERVLGERIYSSHPSRGSFERPYGWAWIMALQVELEELARSCPGHNWAGALLPLATCFRDKLVHFLPQATYPTRGGTHFNSAFALRLAQRYARHNDDGELGRLIDTSARRWYGDDVNCQAWEPSGDDFLSPTLVEAELMRTVLSQAEFKIWFDRFLPGLRTGMPKTVFTPAIVTDRTDPKTVHLDGLNLTRAWCLFNLARAIHNDAETHDRLLRAAESHLARGLPHVRGDYMGEHWLATYAVLAMEAAEGRMDQF
jgi:hypothetical protein